MCVEGLIMAKIDKLLKQAEEHFDDGECALQTVFGAYATKIMGGDSLRNGIFIATDQRLLFFANTYPARGLKNLLANVCRRLTGAGGEVASIFRLDTSYGGI